MESGSWKEKFGELNLHGKIVGGSCIDWSHDHQLVIATNKKVLVCDMSILVSATKSEEIGFMIENVPVVTEKEPFLADTPNFLAQFESACFQPSNTKASPNYDVYEYFLDPALYQVKQNDFKGYKSVKFSHPHCTSATGTELLAVLSLDYSLGVYHKVSAGKHSKWLPLCNLTSSLTNYLTSHKNSFPNHQLDEESSEFEVLRDQKYCASISNIAWSDIYDVMNERFCILAASTLNGFIVMWKFHMNEDNQFYPEIITVFSTNWTNIAQIAWLKDTSNRYNEKDRAMGLAVSSSEGQLCCRRLTLPHTFDWINCLKADLWEENDRLAPRKIHWINYRDKSLLIASKSHVLVAWILDANLKVLSEFILQDVHCMPITCLNLFEKDGKLQCFSSSSDGVLALIDIKTSPQLELEVNKLLGSPSDFGSFRVISPSTLRETALSPNKAFMVMLTSRPHVRLSVQVENEASIFMKRLLSPKEAAEQLLEIAFSGDDESLYKYMDLLEITRQHYAMKRKFDSFESFLGQTDIKLEYDIRKLQFRLGSLMVCNILSFLGAIFLGLSKDSKTVITFIAGRIIIGIFAGLSSTLVPMYICEISPPSWRRNIVFLFQIFFSIGLLAGQVLGTTSLLGSVDYWPILFACTCIPSIFSISLYGIMPTVRSRCSSVSDNNAQDTIAIQALAGSSKPMRCDAMLRQCSFQALSLVDFVKSRKLRARVVIFTVIMLAHQFCGVNAVFYYNDLILSRSGIREVSTQEDLFIVLGLVYFIASMMASSVYRRVNINAILASGFAALAICLILLTIGLNFQESNLEVNWMSYATIGILVTYIAAYALAAGPTSWLIIAVIFPPSARPAAFMYGSIVDWIGHIIIARTFVESELAFGSFVYTIYAATCVMASVYVMLYVPSPLAPKVTVPEAEICFEPDDSGPSDNPDDESGAEWGETSKGPEQKIVRSSFQGLKNTPVTQQSPNRTSVPANFYSGGGATASANVAPFLVTQSSNLMQFSSNNFGGPSTSV